MLTDLDADALCGDARSSCRLRKIKSQVAWWAWSVRYWTSSADRWYQVVVTVVQAK